MTEMVVTVGSFIVHLFRKVCSACLVKSWKTGSENFQISYHICSDADGACLVTGLRMSFYWVRVGEIFLMKIQPSPFHSQFRADCSHKVDPHFLRLSAFRLHTSDNDANKNSESEKTRLSTSEKMSPKAYGCPGIKFCQKPAFNWCNQLLNDLHF
ncbi:hypothetical protein Tsp_01575 [Trichinella spiralis]|uniref:hypothetical protein n=1 Tax=Trichinella spiralis TaxID=6334 RepID=UPI0001EFC091|nr:hypothetical protein Tsp_01575 [Trichinella spiralis]